MTGKGRLPGPGAWGCASGSMLIFAVGAFVLSAGVAVISYERSRTYLVSQRQTSLDQQTFTNARLVQEQAAGGRARSGWRSSPRWDRGLALRTCWCATASVDRL